MVKGPVCQQHPLGPQLRKSRPQLRLSHTNMHTELEASCYPSLPMRLGHKAYLGLWVPDCNKDQPLGVLPDNRCKDGYPPSPRLVPLPHVLAPPGVGKSWRGPQPASCRVRCL